MKLGFCMLKTRRMSSQEAAVRICHLPYTYSLLSIHWLYIFFNDVSILFEFREFQRIEQPGIPWIETSLENLSETSCENSTLRFVDEAAGK